MAEISLADARRDFTGTVVKLRGQPFFVESVDEGDESDEIVKGFYIRKPRKIIEVKLSVFIDVWSPVEKLGFVNTQHGVVSTGRRTARMYKFSVHSENVSFLSVCPEVHDENYPLRINRPEFGDMVIGEYPKLEQCFELLKTRKAVAFCRELAVSSKGSIVDLFGNRVGLHNQGKLEFFNKSLERIYGTYS